MIINGKERGLLLTVGASANIAKICPNKDIARIGEVMSEPDWSNKMDALIEIARELNKGYETYKKFADGDHVVDIVTREELSILPLGTFIKLQDEIAKAITEGFETSVETESTGKKAEVIQG